MIIEHFQQFLIAAHIMILDVVTNAPVILNPEHNIPGLVVSPTFILNVQQVGLMGAGCGCHGVGCELVQCSRSGGAVRPRRGIRWRWCPCSPRVPGAWCLPCSPAARCARVPGQQSSGWCAWRLRCPPGSCGRVGASAVGLPWSVRGGELVQCSRWVGHRRVPRVPVDQAATTWVSCSLRMAVFTKRPTDSLLAITSES